MGRGVLADILNVQVGNPTEEISTVTCELDTSGDLAGLSWKFTVTDGVVDYTYQPYYVVAGVGADPTLGKAESDQITNRADAAGNLASTYFTINDGLSTAETEYYVYFHIADVGGYQEYGLTGKSGATDTGLVAETKYYFKVTFNGGDEVEYDITTPVGTITFTILMALLNATAAGKWGTWTIIGGDLVCTSKSTAVGSAILLVDGTTGTCLATTLTDFTDYDAAVPRVTTYDPKVGQVEATNITLRADAAGDLDGSYWILADGGDNAFYVWYAVAGETNTDPAPGGTGIRVDILSGASAATVCQKTRAAINGQETAIFSVDLLGAVKIRVINLQAGHPTAAADGDIGGTFAVAVVQDGVDAVGGLALVTLLCAPVVTVGMTDTLVNTSLVAALVAAGWAAVAQSGASDHILDVAHPTKGNPTNTADGDVGGVFAVSVTTGVDPTASSTLISVAIAIDEDEAAADVATKSAAALAAVSKMSLRAGFGTSTADLIITNRRGGVVADTADVDTGWLTWVKTQDGSAVVVYDMGQDAATANYWYRPAEGKTLKIARLIFVLSDTAVTAGGSFGALAALTNGFNIRVCEADGTLIKDLVSIIKTNAEVVAMGEANILSTTHLNVMIDIEKIHGAPVVVHGNLGEYIECDVNDNLNGLTGMFLRVQGWLEDTLG